MIEFITLFLGGLVVGPQQVEMMAGDNVAIVEVRLDGALERRLASPPWKLEVDFGPDLVPHLLEAVALDDSELEVARTRQWVNMSPQPAQISLLIEDAATGHGAVAKVTWASIAEENEPTRTEVLFNGESLAVDDPTSIPLPDFDPQQTHHLHVKLRFSDVLASEAEVVFGGEYGSEVSTEITAVPIRFEKGNKPRSVEAMQNWFTVNGEPENVHAVEKGLADIVVVRDGATAQRIAELASQAARLETDIHLKELHRISFVSPCPEVQIRDGNRQWVYPRTQRYSSSRDGTLLKMLDWLTPADCPVEMQQIADAVGVAGLSASADGRRRVVILLINGEPRDRSLFNPDQVAAYLRRLGVPLLIWNLDPSQGLDTRWSQATDVRKLGRFGKAFKLAEKDLEQQLIVWLEGLHLPQSVELREGIEGVSLVE